MTQKPERLEAAPSGLSQWGPLVSGPKEKKRKKKNARDSGPQGKCTAQVCGASVGGLPWVAGHIFIYAKQPEKSVSEGLNCSCEGCGWLTERGKLTTKAVGVCRGQCSGR